jgi:hypothetical protein
MFSLFFASPYESDRWELRCYVGPFLFDVERQAKIPTPTKRPKSWFIETHINERILWQFESHAVHLSSINQLLRYSKDHQD